MRRVIRPLAIAAFLFSLSLSAAAVAGEGADFSLIEVKHYNPRQSGSFIRGTKQTLSGLLNSVGGGFVRDEIESSLREELENSAEIREYLRTDQERSDLTKRLMSGIARHMKGGVSNASSVATVKFIGREIFGTIAGKALAQNGVSDEKSRARWVEKLMTSFDRCTAVARTVFEANACLDAAKAGLPANVGLVLVHHLTRQELLPSVPEPGGIPARARFESDLDLTYRLCLSKAGMDARECVLRSMRAGTITVSEVQLRAALGKLFKPAEVERIKSDPEVWPRYWSCIDGSKSSEQMRACIDGLTIHAGSAAAQVKIQMEKAVNDAYPSAKERAGLAASQRALFRKCGEEQLARNTRLNGSLDLSRCQDLVENRVIGGIARASFKKSADEHLEAGDEQASAVVRGTLAGFDRCWNDSLKEEGRQACLRQAVIHAAETIGGRVLDVRVPELVFKRAPEFRGGLLKKLRTCLDRELPADVIRSPDRDRRIESCTGRMRREAALPSAKAMLEQSFHNHLSQGEMDALLKKRVHGQFASCLGEDPNGARLDACGVVLTREAAKDAGRWILPREIRKNLGKSSVLSQSADAEIEPFVARLTSDLEGCLDREISEKRPLDAARDAETCYKKSIRGVVGFIGKLQFDAETVELYASRPERKSQLRQGLLGKLDACADQGIRSSMPLDRFVAFMKDCGDRSAAELTMEVATDEIEIAVERYLADGPHGKFQAERERVRAEILADFRRCMGGGPSERGSCVDRLQRQAYETIGIAAGSAQVRLQLGERKPREIQAAEQSFSACVARAPDGAGLSNALKECTKSYTLRTANVVGDLKVRQALKSAMGAGGYAEGLPAIESAIADFRGCLKQAGALEMGDELMKRITDCAARLQNDARGVVQARIRKLMGDPVTGSDPAQSARELLARALPCLDGLMASTPTASVEQAGVDPDGILDAMVKYLRDYIDYDAEKAHKDVGLILSELQNDLTVVGHEAARRKLVQLLVDRGALDQVIKSVVKANVSQTFSAMPEEERLARDVESRLLAQGTYDRVFSAPEGAIIRDRIVEGVIKPVLLEGKSMKHPAVLAAAAGARRDIGTLLTDSDDFGTILISASVQRKMDDLDVASRFFARLLYGKESLDWSRVRSTEKGKAAELYIRQSILRPKLTGEELSPEEQARRLQVAKTKVTEAATARL